MPQPTRKERTCDDCYFRRRGLCALDLESPCPTFRAATTTLTPPPHAPLLARPYATGPYAEPTPAAA